MQDSLERVELGEAFFPVRRVEIQRADTKEPIKRHWAVVDDDSGDVFSVVTDKYRVVTNKEACELGGKAFSHIFGAEALAGLCPFNVLMPKTRSWAQIDFTAECLAFESCRGDRWFPFLRVVNSYKILDLKVPEKIPEMPLQARGWRRLGPHLKELGERYSEELGDNAYALLNATSDYAGHARAPRMNPVLVNCFQSRCGRWAVLMADQSSAQPTASVTIAEANLAAAERLMFFA